MKLNNIFLLILIIFIISISSTYVWYISKTIQSPMLISMTQELIDETKGYFDGLYDVSTGREYKKGFYNPPKQSDSYWKGYKKGYNNKINKEEIKNENF